MRVSHCWLACWIGSGAGLVRKKEKPLADNIAADTPETPNGPTQQPVNVLGPGLSRRRINHEEKGPEQKSVDDLMENNSLEQKSSDVLVGQKGPGEG